MLQDYVFLEKQVDAHSSTPSLIATLPNKTCPADYSALNNTV